MVSGSVNGHRKGGEVRGQLSSRKMSGGAEKKYMGNIIVADWLRITYRFCENAGMNFNLRMNVSGILPLATSLQISLSHSSPPPMVLTFFLVALLQRARRYLGVPLLPDGHLTCTLSPRGPRVVVRISQPKIAFSVSRRECYVVVRSFSYLFFFIAK